MGLTKLPQTVGPYRVIQRMGAGGMGVVYMCAAPQGETVAVKVMLAGADATSLQRQRFFREVEALRKVDHPHVIKLVDAGVTPEGLPYLVTEWIEGFPLETKVRAGKHMASQQAGELVAKLARALQHVHELGIVHRDLKPSNVMIRRGSGEPVLIDFGLAKEMEDAALTAGTVKGSWLGTPAYWPPEQAQGDLEAIGPWSDVYGLGGVLFALLTGRPPHQGHTFLEQLTAWSRGSELSPEEQRRVQRYVSPGLWAICRRALDPEPTRRQASAAELAAELESWIRLRTQPRPPEPTQPWGRAAAGTLTGLQRVALLLFLVAAGLAGLLLVSSAF